MRTVCQRLLGSGLCAAALLGAPSTAEVSAAPLHVALVSNAPTYALDTNFRYTYRNAKNETITWRHSGQVQDGGHLWNQTPRTKRPGFLMRETPRGLYKSTPYARYALQLSYPVRRGASWGRSGDLARPASAVTAVLPTVTVPAGVFKRVVEVRSGLHRCYYAPGVGFILEREGSKRVLQLIRLQPNAR